MSNAKVSPSSLSILGAIVAAQGKRGKDGMNPSLTCGGDGACVVGACWHGIPPKCFCCSHHTEVCPHASRESWESP